MVTRNIDLPSQITCLKFFHKTDKTEAVVGVVERSKVGAPRSERHAHGPFGVHVLLVQTFAGLHVSFGRGGLSLVLEGDGWGRFVVDPVLPVLEGSRS